MGAVCGLEDRSGLESERSEIGAVWDRSGLGSERSGAVWDPEFGPEKVRKMDALRATSKSIFAQLCRQLPFPDDGVGGWIFPSSLRREEGGLVFCLLSSVFCL